MRNSCGTNRIATGCFDRMFLFQDLKSEHPPSDNRPIASNASQSRRKNAALSHPSERPLDQFLAIAVNNAWVKLDKYYDLADRSVAYIAAVILNPALNGSTLKSIGQRRQIWLAIEGEISSTVGSVQEGSPCTNSGTYYG